MKKLAVIITVLSFAFTVLNSQVPKSEQAVESFVIKSLKSGNTKVTIQYNQDMLREIINYEKPDSNGIYQPGSKYLYEYNDSGKATLIQTIVFKDGEWEIYEKRIFQYDEAGRLIKNITMNIFGNMVDMDTAAVYESVYDDSGNIIEQIDKSKVIGAEVQNKTKTTYQYTPTKKVKTQNKFKWENDTWIDYSLIKKRYNEYDSLICDSTFMWKDNNWTNSMLFNYGYDSARNFSLLEIFIYEESQWSKMERYRYSYDESRRRVETIKAMGNNNQWVDGGRSTTEFRSDGQTSNEKGYSLENGEWEVVSIIEYIYNIDDKNTEIIRKLLLSDVWTNTYRYIYEYSAGSILQNLKYQIWKDGDWQKADQILPFRDKYYEYRHEGYELNLQFMPVSVEELQSLSQISLYPNPAGDFININLSKGLQPLVQNVQIFDMLGIEVGQSSLIVNAMKNNSQAGMLDLLRNNISHLPTGVYYIRIGDKVEKFVKK